MGNIREGFDVWSQEDSAAPARLFCGVATLHFRREIVWSWTPLGADADNRTEVVGLAPDAVTDDSSYVRGVATPLSGTYTCAVAALNGQRLNKTVTFHRILVCLLVQFVFFFNRVRSHFSQISLDVANLQVDFQTGHSFSLDCPFDEATHPKVWWTKNGIKVKGRMEDDRLRYEVAGSTTDDAGVYRCVVQDGADRIERPFNVQVVQPVLFKGILVAIVVVIIIAIVLLTILVNKIHHEKKRKAVFRSHQLDRFDQGNPESFNPDLPMDEQADLLPYDRKWEIPRERLHLGRQLGAGAFGRVVKGRAFGIRDGEPFTTVAVKMVRADANMLALKALMSELKIMVNLGSHPNVVSVLGACTKKITKGELLVIVEYCHHGNVHDYLVDQRHRFVDEVDPDTRRLNSASPAGINGAADHEINEENDDEPLNTRVLICWAFQIARGMNYLANKKVLHGDLAARNILLAEDNVVKVADFGMAREVYRCGNYKKKGQGPLPVKWMALESIVDRVFSTKSDVWAYGVVLWELFSLGKTPYPGIEPDEHFFRKLLDGYRMEVPAGAPGPVGVLMNRCWNADAKHRPTFAQLEVALAGELDESVRRRYTEADPSPFQPLYVNERPATAYINVPQQDTTEAGSVYLPMSDLSGPSQGTAEPSSDYMTMTPSPTSPTFPTFPTFPTSPAGASSPPRTDWAIPEMSAFANPSYGPVPLNFEFDADTFAAQ